MEPYEIVGLLTLAALAGGVLGYFVAPVLVERWRARQKRSHGGALRVGSEALHDAKQQQANALARQEAQQQQRTGQPF